MYNLCPDFEGLIQQKIIYSISTIAAVVTKSVSYNCNDKKLEVFHFPDSIKGEST